MLHVSAPTTLASKHDGADFEPDDEWKRQLKERIEETFKSMIQDAKDSQQAQLMNGHVGQTTRDRLNSEYKQALNNIKGLAEEQYQLALMKERNERRWIAGAPMMSGWNDVLHEEQQNIMNSIKQSNNSGNSARTASESPTVERGTDGPPLPPPSSAPITAAHHESAPQSSDPQPPPTREARTRERPLSKTSSPSSPLDRRRHDNTTQRSLSRNPRDHTPPPPPPNSSQRHNHERPSLSSIFPNAELTEEPEDLQSGSRPSSGRPRANSEKPWDSSLGRSSGSIRSVSSADRGFGRSPPKNSHTPPIHNPERRSSMSSQDDSPLPLGRRRSTASMRSTGSGNSGKSIRQQPTTETIPERADDGEDSPPPSNFKDRGDRDHESRRERDQERPRKSTIDKAPREKESKRGSRRDSRPSPVDAAVAMNRYDNDPSLASSGLRSSSGPSSATMQYATSSSSSFVEDRYHHTTERERPLKSPSSEVPYHTHNSSYANIPPSLVRHGSAPQHRSSPYAAAGEETDFIGPYPPLGHPPAGPKSPFGGDRERDNLRDRERDRESLREQREREYQHSISHKSSFSSYEGRDRDGRRRERERERDWELHPHWDEEREAAQREREYWDRENREREQWDREREREREHQREREQRERERERERERDRDLYDSRHREREYAHPHQAPYSARPGGYPTPPSSAPRVSLSHVGVTDYLPMGDIYDETPIPSSARGYGSYRPVPPPTPPVGSHDDWEFASRPESGRPSIPSRQNTFVRREGERRGTIDDGPPELDGYPSRSYAQGAQPLEGIPIPRSNGGMEDAPTPAWQNWHAEGIRHRPPPSNAGDTWVTPGRPPSTLSPSFPGPNGILPPLHPPPPLAPSVHPNSGAPIAEDHQRRTERRASVKSYRGQGNTNNVNHHSRDVEYEEDRYDFSPPAATAPAPAPPASNGTRNRVLLNEDQDDEEYSAESGLSDSNSEESGDDQHDEEEEEEEEEEEQEEEEEEEAEEETDDDCQKARELDLETRRLALERKEADAKIREQALELQRLQDEERRMKEEARKMDEDVKQKEDEMRRKEEEAVRLAETRRLAEEARRKEEEAVRLADEARKKEEETNKKEKEVKKREEEARRKAEDARKLRMEASRRAEEAKRKEADLKIKEEATRVKEEKLKEDEARNRELKEQAERIAHEANRAKENLRRLEEETRKKELQIQEREAALLLREEELKRREAESRQKEEDTKRKEAEQLREESRRKEEETREAAKRKDDEARAARAEKDRIRREQDAQRQQQQYESERRFQDEAFIAGLDPKVVEEQHRLLQQAQFRKREEEIKRSRAEDRKRHDSVGADSAWTPSFSTASPGPYASTSNANHTNAYPPVSPNNFASSSPGTSPGVSRSPPQYTGPSNSDRSSGTSNWSSSNSAWSTSTKPTTPSTARPSSSIPSSFGKPRNGSVSSATYPNTSGSPLNTSGFSESDWARRQAEFHNDQQEKFRREQEKIEADIQMRSAGKPLTREEMGRVFDNHEKLWSLITVPGTEQFTWNDIPWPMARMPTSPEDITQPLVGAYMRSPYWPDKDGAKSTKDRIKESLKRWHPDRFDNRCLVRVIDSDQERVKLASGNVVRFLNELLRKENEASNGLFGGD